MPHKSRRNGQVFSSIWVSKLLERPLKVEYVHTNSGFHIEGVGYPKLLEYSYFTSITEYLLWLHCRHLIQCGAMDQSMVTRCMQIKSLYHCRTPRTCASIDGLYIERLGGQRFSPNDRSRVPSHLARSLREPWLPGSPAPWVTVGLPETIPANVPQRLVHGPAIAGR